MSKPRLLIMAKRLALGEVKTRLAASVGDKCALEVYKNLLEHTLQVAAQSDFDVHLFLTGEGDDELFMPFAFTQHEQSTGDLGNRMASAFAKGGFASYENKTVIIGTDCPDLSVAHLAKAADSLDTADVVFGPSQDGGYYLLGMKGRQSMLFQNIPWSTETVLETSVQKLQSANLSVAYLDVLNDIDTLADLESSSIYSAFRDQLNTK